MRGVAHELREEHPKCTRAAGNSGVFLGFHAAARGCAVGIKRGGSVPRAHTAHKACFMRHFAVEVPRLDPRWQRHGQRASDAGRKSASESS